MSWSADGRWLAYGFQTSGRTSCLHLYDTASGKITAVTRPDFTDGRPAFDPEGRYLYFISYRIFDPIYDRLYFDLGFPKGSRPFLITLRKDVTSPFSPAGRPPRAPGSPLPGAEGSGPDKDAKGKTEEPKAPPKVEIDFEGIEDRIVAFPAPEGLYGRILGTKQRVFFTSYPVEGSLNMTWASSGEPEAKGTLQVYNFDEEKVDTVVERVTDFTLSGDGNVLGLRAGNKVRVLPVGFKAEGSLPRMNRDARAD